MSVGQIHYRPAGLVLGVGPGTRAAGRIRVDPPPAIDDAPGDRERVVWARLVQWGAVSRFTDDDGRPADEWFTAGSLRLEEDAPFALGHLTLGGRRIGTVLRLANRPAWCDAACWVDTGPAGDAVLTSIPGTAAAAASGDPPIPVSIGFVQPDGGFVEYPPINGVRQIQRNRVRLLEVAIVKAGALKGAQIWGKSTMASVAALAMSK